jgi:integrase
MKAGREHRVPLSGRAIAILWEMMALRTAGNGFVFPNTQGRPLSNMSMEMLLRRMKIDDVTVHGFRSSFRDWAAEETPFAREIAEAALAHVVGDATERAYRRGDALERRRELMQVWVDFLINEAQGAGVP